MDEKEFIEKLKQLLESDIFPEIPHYSRDNMKNGERQTLLTQSLNFLIATRDFDSFEQYMTSGYRRSYPHYFPYQYLQEQKGLTRKEIEQIIYENYIQNGFLFHVTPSYNLDSIFDNGLQSLNDKYKCDLYQKSLEVEGIYENIRRRNQGNFNNLFYPATLLRVPGFSKLPKERFNSVYLSSNLSYILNTYGHSSEFSNFFLNNLLESVNLSILGSPVRSKEEWKKIIISVLDEDKIKIKDEEIEKLFNYYDLIAEDEERDFNSTQTLLMIPTRTIQSNTSVFRNLYQKNQLGLTTEHIVEYNDGEIETFGNIPPENIIALTEEKGKKLSLRMKK